MTNKNKTGLNGQGSGQRETVFECYKYDLKKMGANLLNEISSLQINKTIQFEVSGEKIIVSVTIEQCPKSNYKKIIPLLKTVFEEIETILD